MDSFKVVALVRRSKTHGIRAFGKGSGAEDTETVGWDNP